MVLLVAITDPLDPTGPPILSNDTRFGGALQYQTDFAAAARNDAAKLQYWKTGIEPAGGGEFPGLDVFKDWQTNAIHDVNDLHLDTADQYIARNPPPALPTAMLVTVTEEVGPANQKVYVVHSKDSGVAVVDPATGKPAVMPSPLIPPPSSTSSGNGSATLDLTTLLAALQSLKDAGELQAILALLK